MMTPDDPRHGTPAGYNAHINTRTPTCPPCKEAHRRYNILRNLYPANDQPTLGLRRRIQALQALGHSRNVIAKEMGYTDHGSLQSMMHRSPTVRQATFDKVDAVYERLSMIRPHGPAAERARTWARKHGYAPPLAWDDIDDPAEKPNYGKRADTHACDQAVIERVLGGEWNLPTTRAERIEVIRRFPGTGNELSILTGWKIERYYKATA